MAGKRRAAHTNQRRGFARCGPSRCGAFSDDRIVGGTTERVEAVTQVAALAEDAPPVWAIRSRTALGHLPS